MAISLTKLTANVNNIQALSDTPNETEGLTAQGLKEKFDQAGADIKTYINGTLTTQLENTLTGFENTINSMYSSITNMWSTIYPVGSIYMSVANVDPSNIFGGTWVQWGAGKVPVGINTSDTDFNTSEKTGGEKTHKLTLEEMPKHNHTSSSNDWYVQSSGSLFSKVGTGSTNFRVRAANVDKGDDKPHNNLQPYITCYMWKRIS